MSEPLLATLDSIRRRLGAPRFRADRQGNQYRRVASQDRLQRVC